MDKLPSTEHSSLYNDIENMSTQEILQSINQEDAKVALAVQQCLPQIAVLVDAVAERMKHGGRLFYIGSGTSGRLGVVDASECPPTFGVSDELVVGVIAGGDGAIRKAVEFAEDDTEKAWEDLEAYSIGSLDSIVGLAASGSTPYVLGGIQKAREEGLLTGAITCSPGSKIGQACEYAIEVAVGPEFITGSTRMKSGTAQKMVLNMLSTSVMIKLGRIRGNKMVDMQLSNQKLEFRGARMIMAELNISEEEARSLLKTHGSVRAVLAQAKK
ncbi:N-acetylmuramic acid 6-phosphate etherase [Marinoscillum sp. MHG1-6]|uniref:N-acetylmuramic acid 6-phosphate etherase n=1 Tax=Marinoscillum sp. MHG1-6 TaxID=2959627 RepID=UPI002157F280|nr:N-acetylmuramic acid 6-phosphate etherase [Marinoscillum sp. MHG1-6]